MASHRILHWRGLLAVPFLCVPRSGPASLFFPVFISLHSSLPFSVSIELCLSSLLPSLVCLCPHHHHHMSLCLSSLDLSDSLSFSPCGSLSFFVCTCGQPVKPEHCQEYEGRTDRIPPGRKAGLRGKSSQLRPASALQIRCHLPALLSNPS